MRRYLLLLMPLLACDATNTARDVTDASGDGVALDAVETSDMPGCCCTCPDGYVLGAGSGGACTAVNNALYACDTTCRPECPESPLPKCFEMPRASFFALVQVARGGSSVGSLSEVVVNGTVDGVGDGRAISPSIENPALAIYVGNGGQDSSGYWLRIIEDDDNIAVVEVSVPGARRPALGDRVVVDVWRDEVPWSPQQAQFRMTRSPSDRLVWIAEGGRLTDLGHLPGISLSQAEKVCVGEDYCGGWVGMEIAVLTGASGVRVGPGESKVAGSVQVTYGEALAQTAMQFNCNDWFKSRVALALSWLNLEQ